LTGVTSLRSSSSSFSASREDEKGWYSDMVLVRISGVKNCAMSAPRDQRSVAQASYLRAPKRSSGARYGLRSSDHVSNSFKLHAVISLGLRLTP
jgi:hypothetical protein